MKYYVISMVIHTFIFVVLFFSFGNEKVENNMGEINSINVNLVSMSEDKGERDFNKVKEENVRNVFGEESVESGKNENNVNDEKVEKIEKVKKGEEVKKIEYNRENKDKGVKEQKNNFFWENEREKKSGEIRGTSNKGDYKNIVGNGKGNLVEGNRTGINRGNKNVINSGNDNGNIGNNKVGMGVAKGSMEEKGVSCREGVDFIVDYNSNLAYPLVAKRMGISGDVVVNVKFNINKDGSLSAVAMNGGNRVFQEEVKREIKKIKLKIKNYEIVEKCYISKDFRFRNGG